MTVYVRVTLSVIITSPNVYLKNLKQILTLGAFLGGCDGALTRLICYRI